MKNLTIFLFLLLPSFCFSQQDSSYQAPGDSLKDYENFEFFQNRNNYKARIFWEIGTDHIFSSATIKYNGDKEISPVRYTGFQNLHNTYHFEFGKHFGLYTGIGIQDLGFIQRTDSLRYKRRTYNIFMPFGIKTGNLRNGYIIYAAAEFNYAFNFAEKKFEKRNDKQKFYEFGSTATPQIMLTVIGGIRIKPIGIKFGYTFGNFLNPNYQRKGQLIFSGLDARLMFLSITLDMHFTVSRGANLYKEF